MSGEWFRASRVVVGTLAAALLLTLAALLSVAPATRSVPPSLAVIAPLVAAGLLSVRRTTVVALIAVVEMHLLAAWADGYEGLALYSRTALGVFGGIIAVALSAIRVDRERALTAARDDLLSETLFRTVTETSDDPIYAKDLDGRYILANGAAARSLGCESADDLIGRTDAELADPVTAEWIKADDGRVREGGGLVRFEDVLVVDGEERTFLTHKNVIRNAEGDVTGIAGVSRDVTTWKRAQRELERSEARFRSLVEATSAIVWRADAVGCFAETQRTWELFTGQPWERHRDRGWLDAVHLDDRERFHARWQERVEDGGLFEETGRLWNANMAQYRYVSARAVALNDGDGRVTEWLGTCTDINDRMEAERELRRVARVRELVAEVASRVAVANGTTAVLGSALGVLGNRLPAVCVGVTFVRHRHEAVGTTYSVEVDCTSGTPVVGSLRRSAVGIGTGSHPIDADPPLGREPDLFANVADAAVRHPLLAAAVADAGGADLLDLGDLGPLIAVDLMASTLVGVFWIRCQAGIEPATVAITQLALSDLAPVLAHSLTQAAYQEQEAEIASSFQESMLELSWSPDPRLDVAVHYQAGTEQLDAGGDWYDIVALDDGRIGLMIGDVVGRSLTAATVMGRLRAAGRALLLADPHPARVLERLDQLARTIDSAPYTTCCCVVVDPVNEELTYSTAGHPPALVVDAGGGTHFLWDAQGPPLALPMHGKSRPYASTPFTVGDRIVLYTDGLVERRRESIDAGLDRLAAAAATDSRSDVARLCRRLVDGLFDDFTQRDDVAVLCAHLVSPSAVEFARSIPPDAAYLRMVRHELTPWLTAIGATPELALDVALAATEAMSNAIDHAGDPAGEIALEVRRTTEAVVLTVRDRGKWDDSPPDPSRGRGLEIMRSLAGEVAIERNERGSAVTVLFPLAG